MKLPISPGEKYALIALDAFTDFTGELDLGGCLFAVRGGIRLPDHWKEWIGSIETGHIEGSNLVLLAKAASQTPTVLDGENQRLQHRTEWFFWSLLATTPLWVRNEIIQLTGGLDPAGEGDLKSRASLSMIGHLGGLHRVRIREEHLRRAASLSRNLGELMARREMRRARLALRTFWSAFGEMDLGQRIHQLVRVVSEGFTKSWGRVDFMARSDIFVLSESKIARRQLYLMRNNAEHFNKPDLKLTRLSRRRSFELAHLRAHQAEALARHCVTRFVENRALWQHYRTDSRIDAFWKKPTKDLAAFWGAPLDLVP